MSMTKPDRRKLEDEQDKKLKQIKELNVQTAVLKMDIENLRLEMDSEREEVKKKKNDMLNVKEKYIKLTEARNNVSKKAKEAFKGKNISRPDEKKEQLERDLKFMERQMKTAILSNQEEKKLVRNIKQARNELKIVKEFLGSGTKELLEKRKEASEEVQSFKPNYDTQKNIWEEANKSLNAKHAQFEEKRDKRTEISQKIQKCQDDRTALERAYKQEQQAWENSRKRLNELQSRKSYLINKSSMQDEKEPIAEDIKASSSSNAVSSSSSSQSAGKKSEAKPVVKKMSEAERKEKIEKAQKAWEKEKKRFEKEKKRLEKMSMDVKEDNEPASQKVMDPEVEENMRACQSLIERCIALKPQDTQDSPSGKKKKKKKKKKQKLPQFPVEIWQLFGKLEVKMPNVASDLDDTIDALRKKLTEFAEPENSS